MKTLKLLVILALPFMAACVSNEKAAVYRFQKHVSVIDGLYSCSLKNGAEINISEELFKSMIDNLEEMNSFIKEYTEKGEKVNVIEPTEEYLESLLK